MGKFCCKRNRQIVEFGSHAVGEETYRAGSEHAAGQSKLRRRGIVDINLNGAALGFNLHVAPGGQVLAGIGSCHNHGIAVKIDLAVIGVVKQIPVVFPPRRRAGQVPRCFHVKFGREVAKLVIRVCRPRAGVIDGVQGAIVAIPMVGAVLLPRSRPAIGDILIVEIFEIISRRGRAGVAVHFANINAVDTDFGGVEDYVMVLSGG